MRAIDELERARTSSGSVLTIGTFDGVHRGHHRVVELAVKDAREHGLQAGVLTFVTTPRETLRASEPIAYLSDLEGAYRAAARGRRGLCNADHL